VSEQPKILSLRYWDDPVLSTICDKIGDGEFGSQLEEFGRELIATMLAKNGVGLAAPQVGVTKRMFVMALPDHRDLAPIVVCNPALVLNGGATAEREGCLSLPNVYQQVYRAANATMQYQDPTGKHFELSLTASWDARVAQHEFDHLNGIMFFDYKDKRPEPWGARMSKQMSKSTLRDWEKAKRGL
jgi:peptide deformylase